MLLVLAGCGGTAPQRGGVLSWGLAATPLSWGCCKGLWGLPDCSLGVHWDVHWGIHWDIYWGVHWSIHRGARWHIHQGTVPAPLTLPIPFPPLADEMNDHQNTLSYVLINPPPDTRLELNDIV